MCCSKLAPSGNNNNICSFLQPCQDFQTLYQEQDKNQAFSGEQLYTFLRELGLAFPVKAHEQFEDGSGSKLFILVPSLITDDTEEDMKRKHQEMLTSSEAISLQYKVGRSKESVGAFNLLIKAFMEKFLWDGRGGKILDAYNQKVEKRRLGIMGSFHGVLRWSDVGGEGSDELFEFLILNHEERADQYAGLGTFAIQQRISIHLKAWGGGHLSPSAMTILRTLDEEFTQSIPNISRSLLCRECVKRGNFPEGDFPLQRGLTLAEEDGCCSYQNHLTEGGRQSYIHQVL